MCTKCYAGTVDGMQVSISADMDKLTSSDIEQINAFVQFAKLASRLKAGSRKPPSKLLLKSRRNFGRLDRTALIRRIMADLQLLKPIKTP